MWINRKVLQKLTNNLSHKETLNNFIIQKIIFSNDHSNKKIHSSQTTENVWRFHFSLFWMVLQLMTPTYFLICYLALLPPQCKYCLMMGFNYWVGILTYFYSLTISWLEFLFFNFSIFSYLVLYIIYIFLCYIYTVFHC